jgi:hypothetical protein
MFICVYIGAGGFSFEQAAADAEVNGDKGTETEGTDEDLY